MSISSVTDLIYAVAFLTLSIALLLLVFRATMKKIKITCKFFKFKIKSKKK